MYQIKQIGSCGVDSGQLFIIDPCYVKHTEQGNGQYNLEWKEQVVGVSEEGITEVRRIPIAKNDPTLDNEKNFYTKVCEANDEKGYAEVEGGVVVHTTHGDGNYPIEGIFDGDTLIGMFVAFTDNIEFSATENDREEW